MSVSDFEALKKWNQIPKDFQERLLTNVFCSKCFETRVVDYSINSDKFGIVIRGKCEKCGRDIARVVED